MKNNSDQIYCSYLDARIAKQTTTALQQHRLKSVESLVAENIGLSGSSSAEPLSKQRLLDAVDRLSQSTVPTVAKPDKSRKA